MIKTVNLTFYADQIAYDLLSNCNLIKNLLKEGLTEDLKASIECPDSDETKALICRAVTEAWGRVKYLCQRYLRSGRTTDTNVLERLCYERLVTNNTDGVTLQSAGEAQTSGTVSGSTTAATTELVWEQLKLTLYIPNFNTAVTDILKSTIHKYITDYVTYRFLQNIAPEKSAEYLSLADGDGGGSDQIIIYLNTREAFVRRRPSFF